MLDDNEDDTAHTTTMMADSDQAASMRFEIPADEFEEKHSSTENEENPIPVLRRTAQRNKDGEMGRQLPVCVIVVGMAGSGKTTLMTQLQRSLDPPTTAPAAAKDDEPANAAAEEQAYKNKSDPNARDDDDKEEDGSDGELQESNEQQQKQEKPNDDTGEDKRKVGYCLNLDPATLTVPFGASIDIRDTVDYKQVMKQHNLGPNGAIMTSLNLFATKFDQVVNILEKRAYGDDDEERIHDHSPNNEQTTPSTTRPQPSIDYILVDTPGQIEAFTWSASGTIMSEALASSFPTVLAFVVDTVRCASSPNTFMSNMLYACSMLYRTRLPLVIVFNKIDVVPHEFALEWMKDYEAFQDALDEMNATDDTAGYYGSLTRSLSLVLDEFYNNLNSCGVSAATGDGMDEFWVTIDTAAKEFETGYMEDLQNRVDEQKAKKRAKAKQSVQRLQRDIEADKKE